MPDDPQLLVSTNWLAEHLDDSNLRIIDASWYLPDMGRDGREEYETGHIPGAQFLELDALSDLESGLPHTAPSPEHFLSRLRKLGIGDRHQVVVYDGAGLFSAARIWWLFQLMGKTNIAVLDGGLPKWRAEGRPLTSQSMAWEEERHLTAFPISERIADADQVAAAAKSQSHEIVDARGAARFLGQEPEPREGMRSGHIPGSKNLPYRAVLNENGTMQSPEELRKSFLNAGVDLDRPIITTCGSGVSAAILTLALYRVGHENVTLYDGSWAEWGQENGREVATG